MKKRLIMYTNQRRKTAVWMYGPVNSNCEWKVLTSSNMDFFTMAVSHEMINEGAPDCEDLAECARFLITTRGKLQAG